MTRNLFLTACLVATAAGCGLDSRLPTSPPPTSALRSGTPNGRTGLPGARHGVEIFGGHGKLVGCTPREAAYGSALIGPSGGNLLIGPHRLIVPPGALTRFVEISGTVPAGNSLEINLEPHGLTFKKAAGLILDASSCTNVPTIVYLIDQVTPSEPIVAVYSNWWHTIAAPIWHFSGYAVAGRDDANDGEIDGEVGEGDGQIIKQ